MDFWYWHRYRLWVATMVINLDTKHFEETPPHFVGILSSMNINCEPTLRGKEDV